MTRKTGYDDPRFRRRPQRGKTVLPGQQWYDSYRRCTCGHIAAHHNTDDMHACRMGDCECEGFMPKPLTQGEESR